MPFGQEPTLSENEPALIENNPKTSGQTHIPVRTVRFTHVSADFSNVVFLHEYIAPQACGLGGRTQRRGFVQKNGRFRAQLLQGTG
jgi:hypothetical protein